MEGGARSWRAPVKCRRYKGYAGRLGIVYIIGKVAARVKKAINASVDTIVDIWCKNCSSEPECL